MNAQESFPEHGGSQAALWVQNYHHCWCAREDRQVDETQELCRGGASGPDMVRLAGLAVLSRPLPAEPSVMATGLTVAEATELEVR